MSTTGKGKAKAKPKSGKRKPYDTLEDALVYALDKNDIPGERHMHYDLPNLPGKRKDPLFRVLIPESEWQGDDSSSSCSLCGKPFTLKRRRHHCRHCGWLFCSACSSNKVKDARYCALCFAVYTLMRSFKDRGREAESERNDVFRMLTAYYTMFERTTAQSAELQVITLKGLMLCMQKEELRLELVDAHADLVEKMCLDLKTIHDDKRLYLMGTLCNLTCTDNQTVFNLVLRKGLVKNIIAQGEYLCDGYGRLYVGRTLFNLAKFPAAASKIKSPAGFELINALWNDPKDANVPLLLLRAYLVNRNRRASALHRAKTLTDDPAVSAEHLARIHQQCGNAFIQHAIDVLARVFQFDMKKQAVIDVDASQLFDDATPIEYTNKGTSSSVSKEHLKSRMSKRVSLTASAIVGQAGVGSKIVLRIAMVLPGLNEVRHLDLSKQPSDTRVMHVFGTFMDMFNVGQVVQKEYPDVPDAAWDLTLDEEVRMRRLSKFCGMYLVNELNSQGSRQTVSKITVEDLATLEGKWLDMFSFMNNLGLLSNATIVLCLKKHVVGESSVHTFELVDGDLDGAFCDLCDGVFSSMRADSELCPECGFLSHTTCIPAVPNHCAYWGERGNLEKRERDHAMLVQAACAVQRSFRLWQMRSRFTHMVRRMREEARRERERAEREALFQDETRLEERRNYAATVIQRVWKHVSAVDRWRSLVWEVYGNHKLEVAKQLVERMNEEAARQKEAARKQREEQARLEAERKAKEETESSWW